MPVGLSVVGCARKSTTVYCNAGDSGPIVGTVSSISLAPTLTISGESLNYGQIGGALNATAQDCKGSSVSVGSYTYATSDMSIADINPTNGVVCGGSWNRNSGGGIADFTICSPPATTNNKYLAYVTASNGGTTSNPIAVYIHPVVTGIVLTKPLTAAECSANSTDPTSNCCPQATSSTITALPYDGSSCISQNQTRQIAARVYANGIINPANNISCQVGHLTFAPQGASNVVTIDANGVATANQPGSVLVTATVANSSSASSAGFFSTCPPASIVLSPVGLTPVNGAITIALNNSQALNATVLDTNNVALTGLSLEFNSTTPQTTNAASGSILASYPGTATITAVCQPPTCNPSPFSQIGLFGNGKPVTSNGITATAAGNSANVLYIGSTNSQYLLPADFTTNQPGSLIKLPYVPNSMVISQDGSALYLGSSQGLVTVATASNAVSAANQAIPGSVLSISPDGSTIVVTDPTRGTVSLVSSTGSVTTSYGGIGLRSQWTPDSQTVYIVTTTNTLLTHSTQANWQSVSTGAVSYRDVAVTVPGVGAYFAGNVTDGRSYCASTTINNGTVNPPSATNAFFPLADESTAQTDRLAATTDGKHIVGAGIVGGAPVLSDVLYTLPTKTVGSATVIQPCPPEGTLIAPGYFSSTFVTAPLAGITTTGAGAIQGVVPSTDTGLSFITYTGTSGLLPYYLPANSGLGSLKYLALGNGATAASAPVAGVWSTDNKTFYVGSSGDNQVHLIGVSGAAVSETSVITPKLPDASGNTTVPNLIAQRPKRATS